MDREFKTLENELSVRARQQAAVAGLGQRALVGTDLNVLLNESVVLVAETLAVDFCKVLELLPGGEMLLLKAGVGWKEGAVGQALVGAGQNSQAGYTLFSSTPVIVEDLRTEIRFNGPSLLHEHQVVSGMSVIIQGGEKPWGVLGAHSRSYRVFTQDDIHFLQSVANVLAAAIERKRVEQELVALNTSLEKRVAERTAFVRLLQEVAVAANEVPTVAEALQFTLNRVCEQTGWPVGHVYMPAADAAALEVPVAAQIGASPSRFDSLVLVPTSLWYLEDPQRFEAFYQVTVETCLPPGVGLPGIVFQSGRPEWFRDVRKEPGFVRARLASSDLVVKAGFAFPVLVGKDVVAVLEFFSEREEEPDEPLLEMMAHIGTQLGRVVERKRAGAELLRSRQQLAEAQQLAHIGSWDWNILTGGLNWSDELYRIFGLAPGQVVPTYEAFIEWVHPDDRNLVDVAVRKAINDHRPFEFQHRILRSDGEIRIIHGKGKVVLDKIGRSVKMLGTAQDITELKQMEDALQESMRLLENLFESAPDGTVLVDSEGVIVRLNRQMELLFGYDREELLGKPLEILLPERFHLRHVGHRQAYARDSRLRPMGAGLELLGRRKDGTEFSVDIMLSPVQTDHGLMVIAVVRDITQRKQAIQALQSSEARFRTIFEGAAIGIAFVDLDRRILASNPRLQKVFGYSAEELRGMELKALSHPEDEPRTVQLFNTLIKGTDDHLQFEKRYFRKDGQVIWANVTVSLIRDEKGVPRFAIEMIEDITARKEMESELVELQHRLFAGREQERVQLAQEIHDVPMQELYAVLYQLNDLDRAKDGSERTEQVQSLHTSLRQVIDTLRTICGELRSPSLAPFGLEGAIREHAERFAMKHPELKVSLDLMHDGQILPEQMRINLFRIYQQALNNVLRHAQASHIAVRFSLDESQVILEVEDNGRGFKVPQRWIGMARQGHLGLVGAAERAEMFGGKFSVLSTPGKGTLIRVTMPVPHEEGEPYL